MIDKLCVTCIEAIETISHGIKWKTSLTFPPASGWNAMPIVIILQHCKHLLPRIISPTKDPHLCSCTIVSCMRRAY